MDRTTKNAADKVNRHREDGEESIKRTGKVVPIDSGQGTESVQGTTDTNREPEKGRQSRKANE